MIKQIKNVGRRKSIQFVAAFAASLVFGGIASAQQTVKVGVLLPLSGGGAAFGTTSMRGIQLAADDFNKKGGVKSLGGAKIELVVADTPQPSVTAAATQRLISQNKVAAILGSFASSVTLVASEVTERAGVPLVTFSFADEITGRGYKNVFQVTPKATVMGRAQLDYTVALAKANGDSISKIAIFYEDTAYGTTQAKGLRESAKAAGIAVVVDEAYPAGIIDATPLINKLRGSGAQIVFPVSYLNDSILIIRTMRLQNIQIPTVGGAAGYVIPDFRTGLGQYTEGVLSVSTASHDMAPAITGQYKAKYGSFAPHDAILYAAAAEALFLAIDMAGSAEPAKVREALTKIKNCDNFAKASPAGCTSFDQSGSAVGAIPVMVQWRGDDLVTVYPPQVAKSKVVWPKIK